LFEGNPPVIGRWDQEVGLENIAKRMELHGCGVPKYRKQLEPRDRRIVAWNDNWRIKARKRFGVQQSSIWTSMWFKLPSCIAHRRLAWLQFFLPVFIYQE